MLYYAASQISRYVSMFHVVHYISFRIAAALLTVLLISLCFGDWFIATSKKFFTSKIREDVPESHKLKQGSPTMGGVFILIAIFSTMMLWCDMRSPQLLLLLATLLGFGVIGCYDDWCKIEHKRGISGRLKFCLQVVLAVTLVIVWIVVACPSTEIIFPFFKNCRPDIGYLFIPWAVFIIVGTSNAVNLTDGLDGLAIGSLLSNFATFAIIAYLAGHCAFARYLNIPFADTSELSIAAVTLVGASLGFLWFNAYPAQIFMGDVGSLALGAGLGLLALMTKQELLLPIAGGLFVVETLSVVIQVVSFRYFKKRIFKMAPLHHHFELLGWPEAKITARFAIISCILCLIALMTLKVR